MRIDFETCYNCRFYMRGECHFDPPVRLPRKFDPKASEGNRIRDEELIWGWPKTRDDEWCGKYIIASAFME
jgi:hypothetical protein